MIVENASMLLDRLKTANYKQTPNFGLDNISEMLINNISNECKSTLFDESEITKFGSNILRENIDEIIRILIANGTYIPKETMNKIICSEGRILGIYSDIEIYKVIEEQDNQEMKQFAITSDVIIDIDDLDLETKAKVNNELQELVYKNFARQVLLNNLKSFPKQNGFQIFKEKILHGRDNRGTLEKIFKSIFKKNTKYGDEIIKNTVQYHLDYMYDDKFISEIINLINNGKSLIPIDNSNRNPNLLINAITAETVDMMTVMPNINQINKDISQIYADVEARFNCIFNRYN